MGLSILRKLRFNNLGAYENFMLPHPHTFTAQQFGLGAVKPSPHHQEAQYRLYHVR